MKDLILITEDAKRWSLHIEPLEDGIVYLNIFYFGDDVYYKLNKDDAKQIVEHLTKVFEL